MSGLTERRPHAAPKSRSYPLLYAPDEELGDGCAELCARPLKTLAELMSWQPVHSNARGVVMLAQNLSSNQQQGKLRTLLCHDMAGGYLDDRHIQGSHKVDAYRFFNWLNVDIFTYFSHHFITIPPPCWIDCAHRHGVPVLGTFITEWREGRELCESLFSSREAAMLAAKKMVDIATFYCFDGWLINIENDLKGTHIGPLMLFLTQLRNEMRSTNPSSLVIWYDSVTINGDLIWQNELNKENSAYFDITDGIFLNYTWTEGNLIRSALAAGHRQRDVFVGVDVFGRGMVGGGGFNTQEAVAIARRHKLPVALFAQGWVYEKLGSNDFTSNEVRFWSLLEPHLHPRVLTSLPFSSSFCQGRGHKFYVNGEVALERPWTNLSLQQVQPLPRALTLSARGDVSRKAIHYAEPYIHDAYNGGGCLRAYSSEVADDRKEVMLWQILDADVVPTDDIYISVIYQNRPGAKAETCLRLQIRSTDKDALAATSDTLRHIYLISAVDVPSWLPDPLSKVVSVIHLPQQGIPAELKACLPADSPWRQSVHLIQKDLVDKLVITGVQLLAYVGCGCYADLLIGQLQAVTLRNIAGQLESLSNGCHVSSVSSEVSKETRSDGSAAVRIVLMWDHRMPDEVPNSVFCYHVWQVVGSGAASTGDPSKWHLVGSTPAQRYTMQLDLCAGSSVEAVDIAVQVAYATGVCQKLDSVMRSRINI